MKKIAHLTSLSTGMATGSEEHIMKRNAIFRLTRLTALCLVLLCAGMSGLLFTSVARIEANAGRPHAPQSVQAPSQPIPCPELPVRIRGLSVTPAQPAASHTVKISWDFIKPQCFGLEGFRVRGALTFANGQTRNFETLLIGDPNSLQTDVPGVTGQAVRKVRVRVQATAKRQALGANALNENPPPVLVTSCTQLIPLQITQAILDGLQPAPNRPGQDFFPKIKVDWQTNGLPACVTPTSFEVKVKMIAGGKTNQKTVSVPGTQRSVVVVFDTTAVGAGFVPDSISAVIRAVGEATIRGEAEKEIEVN